MAVKRKVCFTGPMRIKVAEDILRKAGCELVLGKPQDDFRTFRYERKELVNLIGDCPIVYPSGRDMIGADILDSCPDLQAVVKSSIGIETVDVDAATDLGILCCNSPTVENYMGVAEATMGLIVALFKRLKFNEAFMRNGGWKELENRGTLMLGKTIGIMKLRGTWKTYRGIPLMPTYHPAYLLRNQALSEKRKIWEDMLQVMEKLGMPISEKQKKFFLRN